MMRLFGFLARLFTIGIAYGAACLAGACTLSMALAIVLAPESIWPSIASSSLRAEAISNVGLSAKVIAVFGLLPSLVAVAFFEKKSTRHWQAYALYGTLLAGFASLFSLGLLGGHGASMPIQFLGMLGSFPVAGAVSGIVYWRIAGRYSGKAPSGAADPTISATA